MWHSFDPKGIDYKTGAMSEPAAVSGVTVADTSAELPDCHPIMLTFHTNPGNENMSLNLTRESARKLAHAILGPATGTLSAGDLQVVAAYAKRYGRTWKAQLCELWLRGEDAYNPALRRVRNIVGPSGLAQLSLPIPPTQPKGT